MPDDANPSLQARVTLSPAHANALSARLQIIEEDCHEIESCLNSAPGILSEVVGEMSDSTRQRIRGILAEMLDGLVPIKLDLELRKRQVDIHNVMMARISHIWVTLHESKAHSLQGYGVVPEELKSYLDPRLDDLLAHLRRVRELVETSQQQTSTRSADETA